MQKMQKMQIDKWKIFCNLNKIPLDYQEVTLKPSSLMSEGRSQIGVDWVKKPRKSLFLYGKTGRGKTYFLHCLMKSIVRRYGLSEIRFFKSKHLDDRMLEEVKEQGTATHFLERIKEIQFLFLDDFGIERAGERAEREYYDLIDERVANRKPTIISTNLNHEDVLKTLGERIHSRLKTYASVEFVGEDIRGVEWNI